MCKNCLNQKGLAPILIIVALLFFGGAIGITCFLITKQASIHSTSFYPNTKPSTSKPAEFASPSVKESLTPTASKLSPRLNRLANWVTTSTIPVDAAEQARLLGLAESGGGSLSRDAAGNPLVDVRVLDTTAETIAALKALPAEVLSVSPEYATVTLAIAPQHLKDLATIPSVQYIGEVIQANHN